MRPSIERIVKLLDFVLEITLRFQDINHRAKIEQLLRLLPPEPLQAYFPLWRLP
jgi:hypothetical protein